ncbi:MAG: arginase family protein [Candidatus Aenigmatarchaeota archaeon]|nr:arginase family protein [Candidatus Aenigmarchaeota archaeon]
MDFSIFYISFDKTQTFRKGSAKAPKIIRNIFPKLETYISGIDLTNIFIKENFISAKNFNELNEKINTMFSNLKEKFPIIIGGEHSISYFTIKQIKPDYIVWLDAHPDCENKNFGHDSVLKYLIEDGYKALLYGIRTYSKEEEKFLRENKIKILKNINEIKKIKGKIYLSIDFDILDPSIMPAVGNPEINGISVLELQNIIKILASKLCAIDFVEYTPLNCKCDEISKTIAAKIIYFSLAEIFKNSK